MALPAPAPIKQQQTVDGIPWLQNSIKEQRWESAFLHFTYIYQKGSRADLDEALGLVREHPQVAEAGFALFQPEALTEWVKDTHTVGEEMWVRSDALCTIVSERKCIQTRENLAAAELEVPSLKPQLALRSDVFEQLSNAERELLETRYELYLHRGSNIGSIVERQVQNISTPGSTAGSDAGSAFASVIYVDNAISKGSYNVWTDLAVSVLGGVAGAAGNKASDQRYRIQYTIRSYNDQLKSVLVTRSSPIGDPLGTCFSVSQLRKVNQNLCEMTPSTVREDYLQ